MLAAGALTTLLACSAPTPAPGAPRARPAPEPTPWRSATPAPSPTPSPATGDPALAIVDSRIPYGPERQAQMAAYALERYGVSTWQLDPTVIVLHFTESGDDPWSTINLFAGNQPNDGTLPGVCTHFLVAKDGTVHDLVPTDVMCRHTIGLNHVAIGIEVVQSTEGHSSAWAEEQIMARPPQADALIALLRRLQAQYAIPADHVVGHGTANDDPHFLDLTGRRNDHTDFGPAGIAAVRARLEAQP